MSYFQSNHLNYSTFVFIKCEIKAKYVRWVAALFKTCLIISLLVLFAPSGFFLALSPKLRKYDQSFTKQCHQKVDEELLKSFWLYRTIL